MVLCAELFAAGALSAYAAQGQPLPDSGMTLDTAELTLDITEGDPDVYKRQVQQCAARYTSYICPVVGGRR